MNNMKQSQNDELSCIPKNHRIKIVAQLAVAVIFFSAILTFFFGFPSESEVLITKNLNTLEALKKELKDNNITYISSDCFRYGDEFQVIIETNDGETFNNFFPRKCTGLYSIKFDKKTGILNYRGREPLDKESKEQFIAQMLAEMNIGIESMKVHRANLLAAKNS
ncbi:MAG: hypothetical protein ACXWTX_02565, partial [Gallionella sp.]